MNSENKKDVEKEIARWSVLIALMVYIILRTLTRETSRLRENRLEKEKVEKSKKILAEQREAIENCERRMNARIEREGWSRFDIGRYGIIFLSKFFPNVVSLLD